jgi:hypothetical protein
MRGRISQRRVSFEVKKLPAVVAAIEQGKAEKTAARRTAGAVVAVGRLRIRIGAALLEQRAGLGVALAARPA